jgi:peptidoglycan DL-endopeptidase CwlO
MGTERLPYVETLEFSDEEDEEPAPRRGRSRDGDKVAKAAVDLIGARRLVVDGEKIRYDCSGFVCAAYKKADQPLRGNTASMQDLAKAERLFHKRKIPSPGDVAFFHNTYDRNRNGKRDDLWSHVAIVEAVDSDGTITLVHKGGRGIRRTMMNLKDPHDKRDSSGKRLNSVLGVHKYGDVLTAELWCGFASLWALDEDEIAQH